jgi:GGDEF domain-containing protein
MFWRRLMITAFFTFFVAIMFWVIPWLPLGLSRDDYNNRVTFLMILMLMASLTAFGAVYLRDMSRRVEQTLLTWSTVNDGLSDLRRREYFFDRIVLECSQSAASGEPFAVIALRLSMPSKSDTEKITRAIHALEPAVREYDCLSSLGPHEIGVLAHGVDQEAVQSLTERLSEMIRTGFPADDTRDLGIQAGCAIYGRDADEAGALVGIARSRLMKQRSEKTPQDAEPATMDRGTTAA